MIKQVKVDPGVVMKAQETLQKPKAIKSIISHLVEVATEAEIAAAEFWREVEGYAKEQYPDFDPNINAIEFNWVHGTFIIVPGK